MSVGEIVLAVLLFIAAAVLTALAVRQLKCKGYCFNNAYIWADKKQRETGDFTPYYKQSGIIFLMIAGLDVLNGLYVLLKTGWLLVGAAALMALTVCYAVSSSVKIEKAKKE
ncbi:MAG: DUF3784 domain-containing protein [Ruminococcus sp.]|nr:DUF3784 domain-containing protein [Ruminococcus sp.]